VVGQAALRNPCTTSADKQFCKVVPGAQGNLPKRLLRYIIAHLKHLLDKPLRNCKHLQWPHGAVNPLPGKGFDDRSRP